MVLVSLLFGINTEESTIDGLSDRVISDGIICMLILFSFDDGADESIVAPFIDVVVAPLNDSSFSSLPRMSYISSASTIDISTTLFS